MAVNILRLDTSIRTTGSHSRALSDKLTEHLATIHSAKVTRRDLTNGISLIDEQWGQANFTAKDERTQLQKTCLLESDLYVEELINTDVIVFALPIYNFGLPAAFKAWIDQVVRSKITFKYTPDGPMGLLVNKKAYVIITSGGTELGSELDFVSDYLRHVLGFIGITDITFIDSSGLGKDEDAVRARCHALIDTL